MLDCFSHEKKTTAQHTLGIDLGDRKHTICIIYDAVIALSVGCMKLLQNVVTNFKFRPIKK